MSELAKLEELHSMGFIDDKEFETRKMEILQNDNLKKSNTTVKVEEDPYAYLNEKPNDDPYAILNENVPKISNEELNFERVPLDTKLLQKYNIPSYQQKILVFKKEDNFYFYHIFDDASKLSEIVSFFGRTAKRSSDEKSTGYLKGVDHINSNLIFDDLEGNIKTGIYLYQDNPIQIYRGSWVAEVKGDLSNVFDYVYDIPPYLPEQFKQDRMSRGPIRWDGITAGSYNPLFVGRYTITQGGQSSFDFSSKTFEGVPTNFSYNRNPSALHFYVRLRYLQLQYSIQKSGLSHYGITSLNEVIPVPFSKNVEIAIEKCLEENKCYLCQQGTSSNNSFLCKEHEDQQVIDFYHKMKNELQQTKLEQLEEEIVYADDSCDQYVPRERIFEDKESKEWVLAYKSKEKFRYIDPESIDLEKEVNLGIALKDLLKLSLNK